jgi:transcriptional regulator with XRE-family HTH domain
MLRAISVANSQGTMPHATTNGFAQRLRELRQQKDLTQQELARKADIHYTHIGRYESCKSMPAADTLKRLAEALGTTVDFLMEGATQESAKVRLTDKVLLQRFEEVERLPDEQKAVILQLMDAFLAFHQMKAYTNRQAG